MVRPETLSETLSVAPAIDEIFTEDCVFYDPKGGVYRGRDEIDRIAGAIKATTLILISADSRARRVRRRQSRPMGVRPAGEAPAYASTDFIIARDGRIAAV